MQQSSGARRAGPSEDGLAEKYRAAQQEVGDLREQLGELQREATKTYVGTAAVHQLAV